jgi:inosose dehydratase
MRAAAREFHHMLLGTDPAYVGLCLDAHWIYRGAENSLVALTDIINLYADRIKLLHLRQSHNGVWSETCETGDIDYARIATILRARGVRPLLVLEQALELGTPSTLGAVAAYQRSRSYIAQVFEEG